MCQSLLPFPRMSVTSTMNLTTFQSTASGPTLTSGPSAAHHAAEESSAGDEQSRSGPRTEAFRAEAGTSSRGRVTKILAKVGGHLTYVDVVE